MITSPHRRFAPLLVTALVAGACAVDHAGLAPAGAAGAGGTVGVDAAGGPPAMQDAEAPSDVEPAPDAEACGSSRCPPCFRCGSGGACEVDPASLWKVKCLSASISATSPGGGAWDPSANNENAQAPDPVCQLRQGQASVAETSVEPNTFQPMWNESITPSTRLSAAFLMSQQAPWSIGVVDDDGANQPGEDICVVIPQLAPGAFTQQTITFGNVQSCDTLVIGLDCVR